MRKLAAVEEARAIMTAGMDWSVWRWLLEKGRVRAIADRATAALDREDSKVKATWSDGLKRAYNDLVDQDEKPKRRRQPEQDKNDETDTIDPAVMRVAKQVKEADDKAERARLEAEDTFDQADRRMSTRLAQEGARKALKTYDLRESAIRKSEVAARSKLL
jgi:hypothetical protein